MLTLCSRATAWQLQLVLWSASSAKWKRQTKVYSSATLHYAGFPSWLVWFLSREGIEEELDKALKGTRRETTRDVWDSPAWEELGNYRLASGNLVFGMFIDWYNPLTNKIAGKKLSLGIILLVCYSLPQELRWLPVNLYALGMTPGLKEPTLNTINYLLKDPIEMLKAFDVGSMLKTRRNPDGRQIRARIFPSITDAVAGQKLEGHASHAANECCPYCREQRATLHRVDLSVKQNPVRLKATGMIVTQTMKYLPKTIVLVTVLRKQTRKTNQKLSKESSLVFSASKI